MEPTTPQPPLELSARIGGRSEDYSTIGRNHAHFVRSLLPPEWSWEGRAVLDFGCGTGRTLVHFANEARLGEFWGCDIDKPSIDWARDNLSPPFHFVANREHPPIDLPSGHFDLVYGMSVFTHLVGTWADWLVEMHRLLKVGGYGVFTFLGEGMFRELTGREWQEDRVGMIGLDVGRSWSMGGPNALHSEWWLRAHWGRLFDVVAVRPFADLENRLGHGWITVRKDERQAPTRAELERPELDSRELASLRFNVELLHERTTALWARQTDGNPFPSPEPLRRRVKDRVVDEARRRLAAPVARRLRNLRADTARDPWPSVGGDTWWDDHFGYAADEVVTFLGEDGLSLEGREVADIGAGDGIIDLGLALKARPKRLVGFDIVPTDTAWLVEQARRRRIVDELPGNLEFAQSQPVVIPADDDSFDAVITWSAFEHVSDPPALMREIRRILRPDGCLFLQLWPFFHSEHGGHLWEWFPGEAFVALRYSHEEIARRMRADPQRTSDFVEGRLKDFETLNRITLDDLQAALESAGFKIGKVELLTNVVHLPDRVDRDFPLSHLMTAGVKMIAAPQ